MGLLAAPVFTSEFALFNLARAFLNLCFLDLDNEVMLEESSVMLEE